MAEFVRNQPRTKPCKSEAFYIAWAKAHTHCAACGRGEDTAFGLSCHHIVKQGRAHEAANLLRLCMTPCHDLAELLDVRGPGALVLEDGKYRHVPGPLLPKITIGIALSMKLRCDPDEMDLGRLQELRGSRLPDPEVIPQFFVDLYRRNRPEAVQ